MKNPDGRLRPGLFARVDLGISHREGVLMVPEEAVLQRADGAVVFRLLEGNHVQRLVVETGVQRDGFVEIVDGLEPDDRIVSRGHAELIDGSKIVARNADGTLAVSSGPRATAETGSEVLAP
jgi:membrane fusion protein (multidrug efflux system)